MDLNFIGFDGVEYILSSIPEELNNYEHYVIVLRHVSSEPFFYILPFNNSLEFYKEEDGRHRFILDGANSFRTFNKFGSSGWAYNPHSFAFSPTNYNGVIYSSDALLDYSDSLYNSESFYWDSTMITSPFVLQPIAEEQQDNFINVFYNIFDVLPILLVVLVSFIGIRKAISWLSSLLRRS